MSPSSPGPAAADCDVLRQRSVCGPSASRGTPEGDLRFSALQTQDQEQQCGQSPGTVHGMDSHTEL